MWPGSEAHIMEVEPSFMDKYNGEEALSNKVSRVLEFLDKPGKENMTINVQHMRPQLIAAYVPNVDADGHKYGPNSTEIRTTIQNVDNMLDEIFQGLEDRNLTNIVNVMIVSDHGMATTDTERLMQLEDLVDTEKIEHIDGWPLYGLRPKNPDDLQGLYDGLVEKAKTNPNFEVYLRDVNMPEKYHFSKNDRIAPLWIVPQTGWAIVTKKEFNVEEAKSKALYITLVDCTGTTTSTRSCEQSLWLEGPRSRTPQIARLESFVSTKPGSGALVIVCRKKLTLHRKY